MGKNANIFKSQGYKVSISQSFKGPGRSTIIRIEGSNINMIQIHLGGGRHVLPYIKISSDKGIIKVVGGSRASYKGKSAEERANFYWVED
ncbi:hypothetical protein RBH29_13685 [Herbivorax sp. ANBcel31]|uniref:hypothetical protein n=1 Tax=Herbivorax sp. ANBcel31 TaxID=3069754 RepID=UPI0027B6E4A3|nr:hypothetical protein [Herbivorax sp. ANBcel31]MDQ2087478.1 hypothetical protein [Herbivorax sp. ANBcel31]